MRDGRRSSRIIWERSKLDSRPPTPPQEQSLHKHQLIPIRKRFSFVRVSHLTQNICDPLMFVRHCSERGQISYFSFQVQVQAKKNGAARWCRLLSNFNNCRQMIRFFCDSVTINDARCWFPGSNAFSEANLSHLHPHPTEKEPPGSGAHSVFAKRLRCVRQVRVRELNTMCERQIAERDRDFFASQHSMFESCAQDL